MEEEVPVRLEDDCADKEEEVRAWEEEEADALVVVVADGVAEVPLEEEELRAAAFGVTAPDPAALPRPLSSSSSGRSN